MTLLEPKIRRSIFSVLYSCVKKFKRAIAQKDTLCNREKVYRLFAFVYKIQFWGRA